MVVRRHAGDIDIVVHYLPLKPECRPVKQKLRRMILEWTMKVKKGVGKQLDVGFLKVTDYPEWLANIVPVPKKDEKVRMCIDYRDVIEPAAQRMTFLCPISIFL